MTLVALDAATCWHLTLALWHTCWIGLVVGGLAAAANRLLRGAPAWQRYWMNMAALALMGACLPVSFAVIRATNAGRDPFPSVAAAESLPVAGRSSEDARESVRVPSLDTPIEPNDAAVAMPANPAVGNPTPAARRVRDQAPAILPASLGSWMQAAAPYITVAYLLGVYLMLFKLIVAIYGGKRLRAGCRPVADKHVLDMLARQSRCLALRLVPVVACCERVAVPVVVGVIRPMILIPAGMLTGLAPDELGAVLTHELAHIRRYDHWLILIQRFLEALLFFHPVAWYLSRQVHVERERCCDDLVVAAGGDRLIYAQSLLRVAEFRLQGDPRRSHLAALAADGQRPSQLRQRVARLLGDAADPRVRFRNRWPVFLIGLACAAALWMVTAGTWQLLAQNKGVKPQTVVVVEWSAVVGEEVMEEIRQLNAVEKNQLADAGTETIRCSADQLRAIIKRQMDDEKKIMPGRRNQVIAPTPAGFRPTGIAHGMTNAGSLRNPAQPRLPVSAAATGGGTVFLEERAGAARLKLDMHFHLQSTEHVAADVKFEESLEDGRAVGFALTANASETWKISLIVVYEALRVPKHQIEMFTALQHEDDWLKRGPLRTRTRVARAAAWNARPNRVAAADPAWTRDLPKGGHVQLVGLARPKLAPLIWWDPAGRPISGAGPQIHANIHDHDLVALVRVWEDGAKRDSLKGGFRGHDSIFDIPDLQRKADGSQLVIAPARLSNANGKSSLEIGAGFGAWTAQAALQTEQGSTATVDGVAVETASTVEFTINHQTTTQFRWTTQRDADLMAIAVASDGQEISPASNPAVYVAGSSAGYNYFYPLLQADIDHYLIKGRPCHWVEFSGFASEPAEALDPPLDFSKGDDDQTAIEKAPSEFIARLPKGVQVELAAVAAHALDAPEWWRPDGTRIAPADSAELTRLWGNWPYDPRPSEYRILMRTRGLASTAGIQFDTFESGYRNGNLSHRRKSDGDRPEEWLTRATIVPFDKERPAVSIKVRLTDAWGPVQAIDAQAKPLASPPIPDELRDDYASAKVRVDHDSNEASRVKLSLRADDVCGVRISLPSDSAQGQVVAFDNDNHAHTSLFSGTAHKGAPGNDDAAFVLFAYFDLPLSRIARFEYKLRPYRHDVKFEDVSLQPDQITKVKIHTKSLALAVVNKDDDDAALRKTLDQIAERGTKNFEAIKTAHIKFRSSSVGGPYKPGTTPDRCRELLEKYDLVQHPDELRDLINEFVDYDEPRLARPWSESELHVAGAKVRETVQYAERAPDIRITDGQTDLRWGEANSQVNIDPVGQSRVYMMGLYDFWQPLRTGQGANPDRLRVVRDRGIATLFFAESAEGYSAEVVVDEATGFLHRTLSRHRDAGIVQQKSWLGWDRTSGGIPYPTVVIRFDYQAGQLTVSNFKIVSEMRLNVPVPESVFQMGAPAGAAIFDSRKDASFSAGRLNREVFDVTSAEQLAEAFKPLDPEPQTPQEKFAVAELRRLYALADDEVLKRIGPPYPASRKHLLKLLGERYMSARRDVRSDVIAWKDGKFADPWTFSGGSYQFQSLIAFLLKLKPTEIEGDPALLKREIPGDFVYRAGAPADRLMESLAEIAGLEFQKSIRLTFRDVERPVYLARGEFKLALPEGRKEIALNGGPHSGHHGEIISYGDAERLLQEIANYIHLPVINETMPSSAQLAWSSRWYDLPATKPGKRFKLDPQVVLKQITEQTGITFTPQNRTVRVLVAESDDAP